MKIEMSEAQKAHLYELVRLRTDLSNELQTQVQTAQAMIASLTKRIQIVAQELGAGLPEGTQVNLEEWCFEVADVSDEEPNERESR